MRNHITVVITTLLLVACSDLELKSDSKDHFFLKSNDAVMPVFVYGNTKSKVFLIYLHGGPGYTSLEAYQDEDSPLTKLQDDYAVVYWEQRCAGTSQGTCNYDKLTFDQYTKDLEKLIVLLKDQYATDVSFFLLGHSWGGALGIQYLSKPDNQSQINGWIDVAGTHDIPRISALSKEMIIEVGARQIVQEKEVEKWQQYVNQAKDNSLLTTDDIFDMNRTALQGEELMQKVDSVNKPLSTIGAANYFFSPLDFHAMSGNKGRTIEALKDDLAKLDLSENTKNVTIPTLLICGKYDFRVPSKFAEEALLRYGSTQKKLYVFDKSAHFPQWNEPERFYQLVKEFMETNK